MELSRILPLHHYISSNSDGLDSNHQSPSFGTAAGVGAGDPTDMYEIMQFMYKQQDTPNLNIPNNNANRKYNNNNNNNVDDAEGSNEGVVYYCDATTNADIAKYYINAYSYYMCKIYCRIIHLSCCYCSNSNDYNDKDDDDNRTCKMVNSINAANTLNILRYSIILLQ